MIRIHRTRSGAILIVAAVLAFTTGRPAHSGTWGQDKGWSLGISLVSDHIGANDPGPGATSTDVFVEETGGGGQIQLGYTFNPAFTLKLTGANARHATTREDIDVDHASAVLEAHFRFLAGNRTQPYLFGGLGGAALEFTSDALQSKASGGVAVFGVGVLYHFTEHLSLDLAGRLDLINWDKVEVTANLPGGESIRLEDPVDESGSAGKILLGLVWSF